MASSPYADLPPDAYWRSGVAGRDPFDTAGLYSPKWRIEADAKIVTAGSCFAQHVGRALRSAGMNVVDTERLPKLLPAEAGRQFGYNLYSARYGNIYTAAQLLQLYREAFKGFEPALPVWPKGDGFVDAQRPGLEPEGLPTEEDVIRHRAAHLGAVRRAFSQGDIFVFTFGLTEAWLHTETGTVYPTAPGTIAGSFDPDQFEFCNFSYEQVLNQFERFRRQMKKRSPELRFLVTVSPVPLTATASGQHVEVATCLSKSILRAVCGALYDRYEDVDYFPSFEIITSQTARASFYEQNLRSVRAEGVSTAMRTFLQAHGLEKVSEAQKSVPSPEMEDAEDDLVCEEALLEAFNR